MSAMSSTTSNTQQHFDGVVEVLQDIDLNRESKLSSLYIYASGTYLSYPATHPDGQYIGHLLPNDPQSWRDVRTEIQYSLGNPRGQRTNVLIGPLRDREGNPVLCLRKYATCQGIKACPFVDPDMSLFEHCQVPPGLIEYQRKLLELTAELSAEDDVYTHTLSLWAMCRDYGCLARSDNENRVCTAEEYMHQRSSVPLKATRGAVTKPTCGGRLYFLRFGQNSVIRCEHYNAETSKSHMNFPVSEASYDLIYLRALFSNDTALLEALEASMKAKGFGPLVPCTRFQNCSSVKVNCEGHHRGTDGSMTMPELRRLPCSSTITIYEPLPAHRTACPNVLIVCSGSHMHPVPLPARTPDSIINKLLPFLSELNDLPDLTARRLIGAETAKFFLKKELPFLSNPSFADLHPSLGNLDHLQVYIDRAILSVYPHGTGWDGVLHLKQVQDCTRPPSQRYIRSVQEKRLQRTPGDTEDVQLLGQVNDPDILRLIICIRSENSHRLVKDARHIQSDISFKRVSGWLEFELGGFDRVNQCAVVYARAYLNRQTAEAHKILLLEIDRIVFEDTGLRIQYRHLYAVDAEDAEFAGIVSWAVDQHRGQAKEYLQAIAPKDKYDLYFPSRLLSDLSPYEHLERILRLCFAHYTRNIQKSTVSKEVKDAMFSLHGVIHKDGTQAAWNNTLAFIEREGKKVGRDWVQDKIKSKFAFPALCWQVTERIPFKIWQASDDTTNVIEALHQDQLRDGSNLTLLGGLLKGEQYDLMRLRLLQNQQETGITSRYQPSTPSSQVYRAVSRQVNSQKRQLDLSDSKIHEQNNKLRKINAELHDAEDLVREGERKVRAGLWAETKLEKARLKLTKLEEKYLKIRNDSKQLQAAKSGSGNVKIDLL